MSFPSTAFSLSRYRLTGGPARGELSLAELNRSMEKFKVKKIRLDGVIHEYSAGWAYPTFMRAVKDWVVDDWDLLDCSVDEGIFLRMHFEVRRIPTSLTQLVFKSELMKEEATLKARLPRRERLLLKEKIKSELQLKALPQVKLVDGFWRDKEKELLIFSTQKRSIEWFLKLFEKSFAEPLGFEVVPFAIADYLKDNDHDLPKGAEKKLDSLLPSMFV